MNEITENQYALIQPYLPVQRGNVRISKLTVLNHYRLVSVGLAICCSRYLSTMSSVIAPLVVENYPRPQKWRPQ